MRRVNEVSLSEMEPVQIDVGDLRRRFRALRAARRLSQADAALLLGVSQATISSFEHGRHAHIRPATLLAIEAFVRNDMRHAHAAKISARMVVRRDLKPECVWCGCRLPKMRRPARYCPQCGGHQSPMCVCGAAAFDTRASFCSACGRALAEIGKPVTARG